MARCFCGCQQKVSFSLRPMNTSGQRVQDAWMAAARFLPPEDPFLAQGREYHQGLMAIVHREADPRAYDVDGMRTWLRDAATVERDGTARLGQWVRSEGISDEEGMRRVHADTAPPDVLAGWRAALRKRADE